MVGCSWLSVGRGYPRTVREAHGMADEGHTRRKFYDIHAATKSSLAEQALRRIADLYAIEADIRGQTADERRTVRQERSRPLRVLSRPLVEAMHAWLNETLERISGRSTLAQAIRYACNHWSGLILFQEDGRLELDTNTVERAKLVKVPPA
jgi:transposase